MKITQPIFCGNGQKRQLVAFPEPPPWRTFSTAGKANRGKKYVPDERQIDAVNLAMYLHRPILITGRPGTGKSTLAYAVSHELGLDAPLVWPINSRSSLAQGLYQYDAVGRFQASGDEGKDIGRFIRLGPLGAALAMSTSEKPVVLLIDEIDKGDADLANDLLHAFEEGRFEIHELQRLADTKRVAVQMPNSFDSVYVDEGIVECKFFPLVIMTSNGERDFPPAFHRRCIRLEIDSPGKAELLEILRKRLNLTNHTAYERLVDDFLAARDVENAQLATDQLLNAVRLIDDGVVANDFAVLKSLGVFKSLSEA